MTMQPFALSLPKTALSPIYLAGMPHILFETWADRFPEAIAVTGEKGVINYLEVERRANQIAHALRVAGVQRGDLVGIFLERGPDLVCGLMGILKSGAAFVALDPRTPKEMLSRMISSVDCRFLISRGDLAQDLPKTHAQLLFYDDPEWLASQPVSRPLSLAGRQDPACVLFTSGSSGRPKAVLYLHRNLAVRFSNTTHLSGFTQFSVFAQTSPVTSIDSIDEILLPLICGGTTAILSHDTVTRPHRLIDSLSVHRVTHILLVPSLLRAILSAQEELQTNLAALETWMIGGEPLTAALTYQFYEQLPRAVLINFYGLTEGDATCQVTSAAVPYDGGVPIGRPVQNTKVYLLDEDLHPVPEGKPGEICLAGEGLFHQYLNCPELNAERWISNPFDSDGAYARLFRTGDIGRSRADGDIEYLGRRDRMIKVRGFRVDLGEVEAALSRHPAVDQCVGVAQQPGGNGHASLQGSTYILAYVVLKQGETASSQDLHECLKHWLPDHAIPSTIILLDSIPLSLNGKVDIHALLQLRAEEREVRQTYAPSHDSLEPRLVQIWEKLLDFHFMP